MHVSFKTACGTLWPKKFLKRLISFLNKKGLGIDHWSTAALIKV